MAKPKRLPAPQAPSVAAAAKAAKPTLKWKAIAQIVVAFVILWVTAAMTTPYIGYWGVGVVGVLTVAAFGLAGYGYWYLRKNQRMVELLQQASDPEGRKAALEKLASGDAKDAMNALAKAQLEAQEDPEQAIRTLEAVDLQKAPAVAQDEVRTMLAFLLLTLGRPKLARPHADLIRLDRRPDPKSKALSAAVMAEALARTGAADEARKLVDTYTADDAALAEVRPALLRAQVWTFHGQVKRGLARKALDALVAIDPNQLGPFVAKGTPQDLQKLAIEALGAAGYASRPKVKMKLPR